MRERPFVRARPRGFSLAELVLTLLVLSLSVLVLLRVVARSTRIAEGGAAAPALSVALSAVENAVSQDLRDAGTGGLPCDEAIRPLRDNNAGAFLVRDSKGESAVARVGTDVLGLRGVLRSPLYRLDARDRASGESFADEIRRSPSSARLHLYVYPALANPPRTWLTRGGLPGALGRPWPRGAAPNEPFDVLLARLKPIKGNRFFLVSDVEGGWAVARVLDNDVSRLETGCECGGSASSPGECPPGRGGCFLELRLDFTDPDAVAFDGKSGAEAPRRLRALAAGGVFDEVLYFVARGEPGKPPDFNAASDPASLSYPNPFLASAEAVGGGLYDIARISDEVEDLQVAFGLAARTGSAADGLEWRAAQRGAPAVSPAEFIGEGGQPVLRAVRVAVVAKSAERFLSVPGKTRPEPDVLPLNAPAPSPAYAGPSPLGWSPDPRRRVDFERALEILTLVPRNYAGARS